jgi:uncharacterized protein (UPF0261 family)
VIIPSGLDAVAARGGSQLPVPRRATACGGATYWRTTPEENDRLGREIAHKASAARGPTAILVPRRGLSALDIEGGPFWWPQADAAPVQSLFNWISPHVPVRELDLHVNDPAFATAAVELLGERPPL